MAKSIKTYMGNFNQSKVTIATSTTTLLSASNRVFVILTNNGSNDVWIKFGADAVLNEGILLKANGGYFGMTKPDAYKGQINGIADTSSVDISYVEGVV